MIERNVACSGCDVSMLIYARDGRRLAGRVNTDLKMPASLAAGPARERNHTAKAQLRQTALTL